jgi:hypothetical protein
LQQSTDARLKYRIYKTNADFLLISIGVFDNPSQTLLSRLPASAHRRLLEPLEEATIGRGRTYYMFAYEYSQLVSHRNAAVSQVLEKLGKGFDRYTRLLAHLRGEYLDLVQELSDGEVYHLERTVNADQARGALHDRQDAFLDAYAAWRRGRSDGDRRRLEAAVAAVRELDPGFSFSLPDPEADAPGAEAPEETPD